MMMGWIFLLPVMLIGLIVAALGWRPWEDQRFTGGSGRPNQGTNQTPSEILKARYAKGEITREEFEEMRGELEK